MGREPGQCTSQDVGRTTRSPCAPASAQHLASSLILSTNVSTEGRALSKAHSFRCFQIIQGTSMAIDCRPLCSAQGVCSLALCHHSMSVGSLVGGCAGMRVQARMSCQVCRANRHTNSMSGHLHVIGGEEERKKKMNKEKEKVVQGGVAFYVVD